MIDKNKVIDVAFANHVPSFKLKDVINDTDRSSYAINPYTYVDGKYITGNLKGSNFQYGTVILGIYNPKFLHREKGESLMHQEIAKIIDVNNNYQDPNVKMMCKALFECAVIDLPEVENPPTISNGAAESNKYIESFAMIIPKLGSIILGISSLSLSHPEILARIGKEFDVKGEVDSSIDKLIQKMSTNWVMNWNIRSEIKNLKFHDTRSALSKQFRQF